MNTSIFVDSLKHLTEARRTVSLSKWIYEELIAKRYSYMKLEASFNRNDLEVSELLISSTTSIEECNKILIDIIKDKSHDELEQQIKLLIDHGASIDTKGSTILDYVIAGRDLDKIKTVLKFKPKLSLRAHLHIISFHDDPALTVLRDHYDFKF